MEYFNYYSELLPSLSNCIFSSIPTITYFASVKFYSYFHQNQKNRQPDKKYIFNSSKNMISSTFANIFISYPLFNYFSEINNINFMMVILGCLLIDSIEYWYHYLFHFNKYLYDNLHCIHHAPCPIDPKVSFANEDLEVIITSPVILILMVFFQFTFYEYITITSLAFCATVCDHTNTSPNKFHVLHHCGNKKTNLQQPFFTFWDHLSGTYNKKSLTKIPFFP